MLKRLGAQVVLTEPQPLKDPNTGVFFSFAPPFPSFSLFFFNGLSLLQEREKAEITLSQIHQEIKEVLKSSSTEVCQFL